MKKQILATVVGALFFSANVNAEGWKLFAGKDAGFVLEPTASIMLGMMKPKEGDSGKILGVEMSFNCPLLQPPTNKIRQQISFAQYDENGAKLSSIEINPHYVVEVYPGLSIGAGPGVGYVLVDASGVDNAFAGQLGASVHYNVSKRFFVGGDMRYQLTDNSDINNSRMALKLGVSF